MHKLMVAYKAAVDNGDLERLQRMNVAVTDLANSFARQINNDGPQAQLEFLMSHASIPEVEQILLEIMDSDSD